VLLAWAILGLITTAPYVRARLSPPAGTAFLGFFFFVDDQYNYFSYVDQARRGALLFENKLVLAPHPHVFVNLEWWIAGRLAAAFGGRPFLAWRILGLLAALALLGGVDRWLRAGGLPHTHRFAALLLVGFGGGLGGLAWRAGAIPLPEAIDLTTGLFPSIEMLANPHFTCGTALFLWSLRAFAEAENTRDHARAIALGSILGLVRPYDLVLLGVVRGVAVLATEPPRRWLTRLLPLLGLLPVVGYLGWVFYGLPWFGSFGLTYAFPPVRSFLVALGPAALLTVGVARTADRSAARSAHVHLVAWVALGLLVLALRPVGFALQFMVGLGAPLLALAALGLARFQARVTLLAALAMSTTAAAAALSLVFSDNPRWFVPPERMEVARVLSRSCRPGDLLLAPPDIGLYAGGLSACKAYVSHMVAPGHLERADTARAFYENRPPSERAALLDRLCVTHVVLPGEAGPGGVEWLGEGSAFHEIGTVGQGPRRIDIFARSLTLPGAGEASLPTGCPPSP
jgi:hypothetical protein